MNTWIRRTLQVGLVSAGFVLVAGAAAQAGVVSSDNDGILNGTQVVAPVQLPTNVCGNAIGVLGNATAGCEGGATARHTTSGGGGILSEDNDGIANGTQIVAPIQAPLNVSGNALGVLGNATAGSVGGATAETKSAGSGPASLPHAVSWDNDGVLNGTQILAPIQAPINVCGNAVGVASHAEAGCVGGATARYTTGVVGGPGTGLLSAGNDGIANGTQVLAPIQVPVNVCGNAVSALHGHAVAGCENGALAKFGPHTPTAAELAKARNTMTTGPGGGGNPGTPGTMGGGLISDDNDGIGNGTQVFAPIQVPVNVCGNAVGVAGDATAGCEGGATARNTFGGWIISHDNDGILNGTQLVTPIQVPVNVSGNAVGVLGNAIAGSTGGSTAQM